MNTQIPKQVLIAGGGIGGLAAALTISRVGAQVRLYEQADEFSEVGAGIQLGPNVTRLLRDWGLETALADVAAFPDALQVRNAMSGDDVGALRLGTSFVQRYGAPYATIHRADMQQLLLDAVRHRTDTRLYLQSRIEHFSQDDEGVTLQTTDGRQVHGDMLVGADGVWSRVRALLLNDGSARVSGHLAYRAMVPQHSLPAPLRSQRITVWMGEKLHLVQYPVRAGEWLNVVAIIHGRIDKGDLESWDHGANAADLRAALSGTCKSLRDLVGAIPQWRLWPLCDRPPMRGAHEQARGRVALLGDAAHPMRPYLAQGACMAIEDAAELGRVLSRSDLELPQALGQYAHKRWQRNAQVQTHAIRNGEIFHSTGLLRWGRDLSIKLLGERLLDQPWLYRG
jgi:salicylate hydroxylase